MFLRLWGTLLLTLDLVLFILGATEIWQLKRVLLTGIAALSLPFVTELSISFIDVWQDGIADFIMS